MQRRARNTGARKSGAAELDTTEMRAPHLNRLAVPTCREDSSRHASRQTEAPPRPAPRRLGLSPTAKPLPTAYKTVRNAAPRNSKTEKKRRHPRSERAPLPH